jgi:protein associated with RNAse G/E
MNYSEELDKVIENGLDELIDLYKSGSNIFSSERNYQYYKEYEELKRLEKGEK